MAYFYTCGYYRNHASFYIKRSITLSFFTEDRGNH